jgi:hypothetical protein
MIRVRSKLLCVFLIGAAALTACGGSKGVSAEAYATSVCGALKTYLSGLQGFATSVTSAVTANATPENGKAQLQKFVGDLGKATDTLISDLKAAGTPDITNGAQFTSALVSAFEQTKAGVDKLKTEIDGLPIDLQGFTAGTQKITTDMTTVFDSAGKSLEKLKAPELEKASSTNPNCQSIGA